MTVRKWMLNGVKEKAEASDDFCTGTHDFLNLTWALLIVPLSQKETLSKQTKWRQNIATNCSFRPPPKMGRTIVTKTSMRNGKWEYKRKRGFA